MQVIAPAKINLSLRVLGRRSDGFHEIKTLIAPISLCDEIKIEQRSAKQKIAFRCDDPSVPEGEDNLVVRAAKIFFEETKISSGVSIELKKRIPHGAGLGGFHRIDHRLSQGRTTRPEWGVKVVVVQSPSQGRHE